MVSTDDHPEGTVAPTDGTDRTVRMVRTVLGDIAPESIGVCDAHDHLFLMSPQLPGQEMDSAISAAQELKSFREAGGESLIQWTPHGMGRHAGDLQRLSRTTGVRIVAATGLHQSIHYTPELLDRLRTEGLAELFVRELSEGIADTGVRAGLIKVAGGFHGLDAHARWTMNAAADAHDATGAPIAVHLELGTGALDVLDLLCGELNVAPDRVILGHLNRSPDLTVHRQVAQAGAYLAFDGPSRTHHATDWRMPEAVQTLAEAGFADQLLLGGDTTTAGARAVNGGPGLPHLLRRARPRLELAVGRGVVERMLTGNPGRAFAVEWGPESRPRSAHRLAEVRGQV